MTTAIYDNRKEDKIELESKLAIQEQGDEETEFYISNGPMLAKGYVRIVYGDHGPYLEFEREHFQMQLDSKFGNQINPSNLPIDSKYFYYWLHPLGHTNIKVYLQIKPVTGLPNAPMRADGKQSRFNRAEGYADYKRGLYYIDPYTLETRKK